MRWQVILFLILQTNFASYSQNHFFNTSDSLNKGRTIAVSAGIGAVWAGSMIGLSQIWYQGVEKTGFHTFDDSKNWLQMDKVGHIYTANKIAQLSGDLFQWSGVRNNKAAFIGAGVGFGYQFTLEMLDAYSAKWGFSWSDVGANTIGCGIYLGQQLAWKEQRILMKFSSHPTEYAQYRPEILGTSLAERMLKDYNGQTYWLNASPSRFFKNSSFPKWICFSFGYSVDEKLVGDLENFEFIGNSTLLPRSFQSQRQYLFSLDIDFSQLNIKRKWLKTLVSQLNYLKVPFPTVVFMDGNLRGRWMYF